MRPHGWPAPPVLPPKCVLLMVPTREEYGK